MDFVKSGKCLLYFVEEFKSFVDRITSYNVCYTKLLRYLLKVDDIDPKNHFGSDADATELVFIRITDSDTNANSQTFDIGKDMVYASIVYPNQVSAFKLSKELQEGYEIPFLGDKYRIAKIDEDEGIIYLGTAYFDGTIEQNEYISTGEYQVVLGEILEIV